MSLEFPTDNHNSGPLERNEIPEDRSGKGSAMGDGNSVHANAGGANAEDTAVEEAANYQRATPELSIARTAETATGQNASEPIIPAPATARTGMNGTDTAGGSSLHRQQPIDSNSTEPLTQTHPSPLQDDRSTALLEQLLESLAQEETVPPPASTLKGAGFGSYLAVLRRRWVPMFMLFVVVFVSSTWIWVLRPARPTFVATGTVLLPKYVGAPINTLPALGESQSNAQSGNASDVNTEIAIITSPELIRKAMNSLPQGLRSNGWGDPNTQFAPVTATAPPDTTNLINISVTALDPEAAVKLVNSLANVYITRAEETGYRAREQDLKFVGQKVQEAQGLLQKAQNRLQDFRQQTGIFDVNAQLSANALRLQQLQQQAETAIIAAKTGITDPNLTSSDAIIKSDPLSSSLTQKAYEARSRYEAAQREYIPGAAEIREAASDWQAAQREADQRVAVVMGAAHRRAQAEQEALNRRAAEAQSTLTAARRDAARLPAAELQYSQLSGDVTRLQNTFRRLTDYYTTLLLSRNAHIEVPSILNPAAVTNVTASKKKQLLLMVGIAALVLAALFGLLLERLDRSVHAVSDLEPLMHTAVLGSIPDLTRAKEQRLARLADARFAQPAMLESLYILSSNLIAAMMDNSARSVLVTSTAQGEGKSLCALNVATALAYGGYRIVLVDCNLWRPSQHLLNESPLAPGFADIVGGTSFPETVLQPTKTPNLSLLTAGTQPLDPFELLGTARSRQVLQGLQEAYDFVIVDGPPTLSLSDAATLSPLCDGLAIVVADSTPESYVQRAQALLRLAGGKLLGVILNRAKQHEQPTAYSTYASQHGKSSPFVEYEKQLQQATQSNGSSSRQSIVRHP